MIKNQYQTVARQTFLDSLGGEVAQNDAEFFKSSYPAHTMTSASEIFNIWICRMIMLGYHFTDRAPFENVFIHAVARDEKGRKMSKSLGNGIDPVEMLEKYSADSVRMALNSLIVPGRDVLLSQKSADELVIKWRNFGNKLWNISRFLYDSENISELSDKNQTDYTISSASGWIWEKLDELERDIAQNMAIYRLGQVMDDIYHFVWDDLAAWYIEYLKTAPDQILFAKKHVFEPLIKLIHPFIPFETEAIWQELTQLEASLNPNNELLLKQKFAHSKPNLDIVKTQDFENIRTFVIKFRQLRGLYRIDPALKISINSENHLISSYSKFLGLIARLEIINTSKSSSEATFNQKWSNMEFSFDLKSIIPDIGTEIKRTKEDQIKTEADILKLEKLLSNPGFIEKASEETVEKTRQELSTKHEFKAELQAKLEFLK